MLPHNHGSSEGSNRHSSRPWPLQLCSDARNPLLLLPFRIRFHIKNSCFLIFRLMGLIRSFSFQQGCFLVSSPAANAESAPHLKTESLVSESFIFYLIIITMSLFSFHDFQLFEVIMLVGYLFVIVQVLLGDSFFQEREYRRAIVRDSAISFSFSLLHFAVVNY